MFSSNLFSFSRSFSRPSIRSLVSAFLLLALYHVRETNYLPVLAAADAGLRAAQIQMSENFVFSNCRLVFFLLLALDFSSVVLLSFLIFLSETMFLRYFETATKTSAVFLLENGGVEVLLVSDCFSFGGNSNLRNALFGVYWSDSHSLERKTRQIQT